MTWGDLVLMRGRFGSAQVRIAAMTETWENGAHTLAADFGDAPVTVSALLNRSGGARRGDAGE